MSEIIFLTGGAGFIGSDFFLHWGETETPEIVYVRKLTYAGNLRNLKSLEHSAGYHFVHGDICDRDLLRNVFREWQPYAVIHFAAESHVDRSILGPEEFICTNVNGTFRLLEEARQYFSELVPA